MPTVFWVAPACDEPLASTGLTFWLIASLPWSHNNLAHARRQGRQEAADGRYPGRSVRCGEPAGRGRCVLRAVGGRPRWRQPAGCLCPSECQAKCPRVGSASRAVGIMLGRFAGWSVGAAVLHAAAGLVLPHQVTNSGAMAGASPCGSSCSREPAHSCRAQQERAPGGSTAPPGAGRGMQPAWEVCEAAAREHAGRPWCHEHASHVAPVAPPPRPPFPCPPARLLQGQAGDAPRNREAVCM